MKGLNSQKSSVFVLYFQKLSLCSLHVFCKYMLLASNKKTKKWECLEEEESDCNMSFLWETSENVYSPPPTLIKTAKLSF